MDSKQESILGLYFYENNSGYLEINILESLKLFKNRHNLEVNTVYIHPSLERITPKIDGITLKFDEYLISPNFIKVGYEKSNHYQPMPSG